LSPCISRGVASIGRLQQCKPGEVCAIPQVRSTYKAVFWFVAVLVLIALAFPYVLPLFY
jgi:mercuric ion transport protein